MKQPIRPNLDYGTALEHDAADGTIVPLEDKAFCDGKENNEYWDELDDSDASSDMKEYAKSIKCSSLHILQKEAVIRGPGLRGCPFGLPISIACKNAGDTVKQMTVVSDVPEERRAALKKANKRVYIYNQTGQQCMYADKIVENMDKVNCDYGDSGAGEKDFAMTPSPYYPRVFNGLGQYGLYSYPLNNYGDVGQATDAFVSAYSVYAQTDEGNLVKEANSELSESPSDMVIKQK